jgi:predicted phosphodiesterase
VRYLVLSDIHGNLEALEAVLAAGKARGYSSALVLGDLVGYGADPNAVIDLVQSLHPVAIVRGNHDKVAAGVEDAEGFNLTARSAVHWTFEALTDVNRTYLAGLAAGPVAVDELIEICHGTPHDEDAYVFDELDALRALESAHRPVCFFGHTHVPVVCIHSSIGLEVQPLESEHGELVDVLPDKQYLINPGSVGQPRDGDPRAAAAIADTEQRRIELFRVDYEVARAQAKVREAGLPEVLARRLALGR